MELIKKVSNIIRNIRVIQNMSESKHDVSEPILIGVVYSGPATDFKIYLNKKDCLIIYNENFDQFIDKKDFKEGAGNGFLRKYRSDGVPIEKSSISHVLGIPTGTFTKKNTEKHILDNNYNLKYTYRQIIDIAISNIINTVKENKIKYVLWSIDTTGNLGLSTFKDNPGVIDASRYITGELKKYFTNLGFYSNRTVTNHGKYFDITQIP